MEKAATLQKNFEEITPPPVVAEDSKKKVPVAVSYNKKEIIKSRQCPECDCEVQIGEGCMLCLSCGFSACSV